MTIKIPLRVYLNSGHELSKGDTVLCPCHPYVGEVEEELEDHVVNVKMKGDSIYDKDSVYPFLVENLSVPIKIQRFHILDDSDPDLKNV